MSKLPLPIRLLNLTGRAANAVGLHPVNLGLDSLLQKARDKTGLTDFGEDDFRDPLGRLLSGLEQEANLNLMGRVIARADLLRTLENRLGLVDLLKKHPEIGIKILIGFAKFQTDNLRKTSSRLNAYTHLLSTICKQTGKPMPGVEKSLAKDQADRVRETHSISSLSTSKRIYNKIKKLLTKEIF